MAERCRAGGAGIPAFYTPTGIGTILAGFFLFPFSVSFFFFFFFFLFFFLFFFFLLLPPPFFLSSFFQMVPSPPASTPTVLLLFILILVKLGFLMVNHLLWSMPLLVILLLLKVKRNIYSSFDIKRKLSLMRNILFLLIFFFSGLKADTLGNMTFGATTRNFNIPMATAGKVIGCY